MWTFEQTTGRLFDRDGKFVAQGYSGGGIDPHDAGAIAGKNNPALQDVHNVGPIPEGVWSFSAPVDSATHGRYAMRLTPEVDTETFGRDCFLIHGDSVIHPGYASEGCVVQPYTARIQMWESGDHFLRVVERFNVPITT